jgi:REP element-mobilizing transposase RayT
MKKFCWLVMVALTMIGAFAPPVFAATPARRSSSFQTDSERRSYLDFMAEELNRFRVEFLAWCLMKNHTLLLRGIRTSRPAAS